MAWYSWHRLIARSVLWVVSFAGCWAVTMFLCILVTPELGITWSILGACTIGSLFSATFCLLGVTDTRAGVRL